MLFSGLKIEVQSSRTDFTMLRGPCAEPQNHQHHVVVQPLQSDEFKGKDIHRYLALIRSNAASN